MLPSSSSWSNEKERVALLSLSAGRTETRDAINQNHREGPTRNTIPKSMLAEPLSVGVSRRLGRKEKDFAEPFFDATTAEGRTNEIRCTSPEEHLQG